MSDIKMAKVGSLRVGKFVMIDGEPCKIMSIDTSKTGKHGHGKSRVVGMGILDKQKRNFVAPTHTDIEVPIIDRRGGQVLAFMGKDVQLMDLVTYETFELLKPEDDEIDGTLVEGANVDYIVAMGRRKILRVRSSG